MKYRCRIFWISVAKFSKKSQNATNTMGSVSPGSALSIMSPFLKINEKPIGNVTWAQG
jgi:hypothetical protein